jgi:hypothetical protein
MSSILVKPDPDTLGEEMWIFAPGTPHQVTCGSASALVTILMDALEFECDEPDPDPGDPRPEAGVVLDIPGLPERIMSHRWWRVGYLAPGSRWDLDVTALEPWEYPGEKAAWRTCVGDDATSGLEEVAEDLEVVLRSIKVYYEGPPPREGTIAAALEAHKEGDFAQQRLQLEWTEAVGAFDFLSTIERWDWLTPEEPTVDEIAEHLGFDESDQYWLLGYIYQGTPVLIYRTKEGLEVRPYPTTKDTRDIAAQVARVLEDDMDEAIDGEDFLSAPGEAAESIEEDT